MEHCCSEWQNLKIDPASPNAQGSALDPQGDGSLQLAAAWHSFLSIISGPVEMRPIRQSAFGMRSFCAGHKVDAVDQVKHTVCSVPCLPFDGLRGCPAKELSLNTVRGACMTVRCTCHLKTQDAAGSFPNVCQLSFTVA